MSQSSELAVAAVPALGLAALLLVELEDAFQVVFWSVVFQLDWGLGIRVYHSAYGYDRLMTMYD